MRADRAVPSSKDTPSEIAGNQPVDAVSKRIFETLSFAVEQLGAEQALAEWERAAKVVRRKPGRPPKAKLSMTDWVLLVFYDGLRSNPTERHPETIPRYLGQLLMQRAPQGIHIQSADAVERRLRRLLKARRDGKIDPTPLYPGARAIERRPSNIVKKTVSPMGRLKKTESLPRRRT
jgi:hypothetical protein